MSKPEFEPLAPPPAALEFGGNEILRAAIVNNGLQVSLLRAFEKPEVWGLLLADIARHVSRVFAAEDGVPESVVLKKVCDLFDAEMAKPTGLGTTQEMNRN
jgi:hypothetical protein